MGPAMSLVESWTKDIKPENEIAEFIADHFGSLFDMKEATEIDTMAPLLTKVMIFHANEDPMYVEAKLVRYYESFRIFYRELTAKRLKEQAEGLGELDV